MGLQYRDDPDGKKDEFGAVKTYTLAAMTHGGLDPGNEIVDPLIVKPDPLIEAEHEWIRANLHRVATAASFGRSRSERGPMAPSFSPVSPCRLRRPADIADRIRPRPE